MWICQVDGRRQPNPKEARRRCGNSTGSGTAPQRREILWGIHGGLVVLLGIYLTASTLPTDGADDDCPRSAADGWPSETVSDHRQFRRREMNHIDHARRTRRGQVSGGG
jgi:hypothetical protein